MRTVRDQLGKRYLLVKQSAESSRVRDPVTGEERYVENGSLEVLSGESPLVTAAGGVAPPVRRVLTAVPNERALGLLVELVDRGPLSVAELLDAYDLCESDLFGLVTEFRVAGLAEEADVHGERGYRATAVAVEGIERLRSDD
jgi:hypothetical protein